MTVYPSAQSFLGVAKEVTPGTAVMPTRFIPFAGFAPKDVPTLLVDEGVRGSMGSEYGAVMGKNHTEAEYSGVPFSDTFGDLLHNILGGYAVAGAGPFTHTFSLLNSGQGQGPTHTFTDRQGITATVGARAYPHACLSELKISGNAEGLLQVEGKLMGFPSAAAGSAPTNTPPSTSVTPAWRSAVSIGGTPSPTVAEWEVTIKRELVLANATDGTQAPFTIARAEMTVEGKITAWASDQAPLAAETPLTQLVAGTQQAIVISITDLLGGTSGHSLTLTMSKAQFETADLTREKLLGWEIGFKGFMNATDAGASGGQAPIKGVLINGVTTY